MEPKLAAIRAVRTRTSRRQKQLRDKLKRIAELVAEAAEGNDEAESTYIGIINRLEPEMTKKKRKELIRQFRDAVYDHQRQHGRSTR